MGYSVHSKVTKYIFYMNEPTEFMCMCYLWLIIICYEFKINFVYSQQLCQVEMVGLTKCLMLLLKFLLVL